MTLSFDTDFGTFRIKPLHDDGHVYSLCLIKEERTLDLGHFCSINDAILAVVRQETGFPEWDLLSLDDLPYRVFDITCWEFYDFSGTNYIKACS
jgi:hypothetical protein